MVKNYELRIELLSDLCVSDGGVYNSMLDIDICHDEYGFPYIPAKRIKGCLRECGIELADWDDDPKDMERRVNALFGSKGSLDNHARIRIGNAYPTGYDEEKRIVEDNQGNTILHPQNILNHFSYIRSQTAINYDSGVAEEDSLRTMRVVNKGLVFVSSVEIEDDVDEEDVKLLSNCCSVLRHMGISRTRGLGEVKVSLTCSEIASNDKECSIPLTQGANILKYEIDICDPVICKSTNAGEESTVDYIEGSKILGIIASGLKSSGEDFIDYITDGKMICSNAYLCIDGKRAQEVPGYLYSVKNIKDICINKLYENPERRKGYSDKQLNQMKHCYIVADGKSIRKESVETENRYHHRRPDDKAIGRAASVMGDSDAEFYQMSSISRGQTFAGYIMGSERQIKKAYEILSSQYETHIGYSSSAEYGRVRIRVTSTDTVQEPEKVFSKDFVAELTAPAIVYSDKAMVTTEPVELEREILAALGMDVAQIGYATENFLRYTTIGGYNVTWNMRKPTISTFDKGTAIAFHFDKPVEIPVGNGIYIGERSAEGYGEIRIKPYVPSDEGYSVGCDSNRDTKGVLKLDIGGNAFLTEICEESMYEYIQKKAVLDANKDIDPSISMKATISNMLLLLNECSTMEEVSEGIEKRFGGKKSELKMEKYTYANKIIADTINNTAGIDRSFAEENRITGFNADSNYIRITYLRAYLIHAKYKLRGEGKA